MKRAALPKRAALALALVLGIAACSSLTGQGLGQSPADQLVTRAEGLAQEQRGLPARELYERTLREYPRDATACARALYGLGRLQADASSAARDYRAAYAAFSRLLAEHPRSPWESEARAWRGVLGDLLAREDEGARLRAQLDWLKRIELDIERRR